MKRVNYLSDSNNILNKLINSEICSSIEKSDELFAEIQSFKSHFKNLARNPEIIRTLMQMEFNFQFYLDVMQIKKEKDSDKILGEIIKTDWSDSTFVVVDYANVEKWLKKCSEQATMGKTVVCLVPARTLSRTKLGSLNICP